MIMETPADQAGISVIVCVYNGGELFKRTLESMARLKIPEQTKTEFLLVDNNSTDGSVEIIKEYTEKSADKFRYLPERRQGLSHALNSGVKNARYQILAFINADIILPENWLLKITEGFQKFDCAALGGRVLPLWETKPPRWLREEIETREIFGPLALCRAKKKTYYPLDLRFFPFTANMAIEKECFNRYGLFRADLGAWPGLKLGGEESDFFYRIFSAGEKICYFPEMTVYHQISGERITRRYIYQTGLLYAISSPFAPQKSRAFKIRNLRSFPKIYLRYLLAGINPRLTKRNAFYYRMKMQALFYRFSHKYFGMKRTVKLARFLRLAD